MIGIEREKENSVSSWGNAYIQPNLATACSTYTVSSHRINTIVGDNDRRRKKALSKRNYSE